MEKDDRRLLTNKVALITGASKGIGKAIAERYAEEGATVYANAREEGGIDEWAKVLSENHGVPVNPLYFDVRDEKAIRENIMKIKKQSGGIDILVNNAGVVSYEMLAMINANHFREMFEVNVVAVIQLIQLVSRLMQRQKSGSIINISSIVGVEGVSGQLAYSATKGAVISLTKSAAKELAVNNIRVNAVAPGMINTERLSQVLTEKFSDRVNSIGMGRLGEPSEVADTCVYLGCDLSKYVTGQIIKVDGGTII
ncbi:SDR family NAD(P)-dependent oxidoreductase [Lewinella sp. LCG006]|uniref:SDR family NAD(P)-dependent oxidoreductase n=1 Tax=Lewinella sp. LCG006 TaxID=3231911 RepID=UPI003460464F